MVTPALKNYLDSPPHHFRRQGQLRGTPGSHGAAVSTNVWPRDLDLSSGAPACILQRLKFEDHQMKTSRMLMAGPGGKEPGVQEWGTCNLNFGVRRFGRLLQVLHS